MKNSKSILRGFTLIELLVVIAIIAILAVVVVLTLNPAELLKQSRDSNRASDMDTLTNALGLYQTDFSASSLGSASTTYISIPDPSATTTAGDQCQGLGLATSSLFTWHCAASSTYRNVDGTGWIPVNFSGMSTKSPLGSLPVDPTNTTSSGYFYTYQMQGTKYELTTNLESQKYQSIETNDGGSYADLFEKGASLALAPQDYANPSLSSGSVTQSNMKMSLIANTAFVDFSSAGTLTSYIGDKLIITDSTGHQLVGYIKAAGSGETYGGEQLGNSTFVNNTSGWLSGGGTYAFLSGGSCHSANCLQLTLGGSYSVAQQYLGNITWSPGMLMRNSVWMKLGTDAGMTAFMSDNLGTIVGTGYVSPASWTNYIFYMAVDSSAGYNQAYGGENTGNTTLFDSPSVKQVLTPSATGVTIVSTAGGSTYNWTSEASGFNRDDSSGYTYSISH